VTPPQQLFLAAAQSVCSAAPDRETSRRWGQRSPPRIRVNRAMAQLPGFASSFRCRPDTPMHPRNRCEIW
jgi:predicted metalloendopeptidase